MLIHGDVLDHLDAGIVILDGNARILHWNLWLSQRTGIEPATILGRTLPEIFGARLEPYFLKSIDRVLRSGSASRLSHALHPNPLPLTNRLVSGDSLVNQAVSLRPYTLGDGSRGCLVEVRDVTEMVRRETALRQQARLAQAANLAKSEFLASMSHELRTPLTAILGFAQVLQRNLGRNLSQRDLERIGYIEQSGSLLLALINDVLELAVVEAKDIKINIETVSAKSVIARVDEMMQPLARRNNIKVFLPNRQEFEVQADELRLSQCLINLVSNAIKYNCVGGKVEIDISEVSPGLVRFAVSDTGRGISDAMRPLAFQPFQRLGAERSAIEGTGIGLSLVKHLVTSMRGKVGFTSAEGIGSTFWIDLPGRERAGVTKSEQPVVAAGKSLPAFGHAGAFSLLYIEDIPSNLHLMEHVMATIPAVTLHLAPNASAGIALAREHRPSLIVLDINMPGMDGYEVLARLKALPETAAIPVLALSASALPRDIARGQAAGFFEYLTKPLDVPIFFEAIERALAARASHADPK